MILLRLLPVILSLLVLAAHFLRQGGLPFAAGLLGLLVLLLLRRVWVARAIQAVLVLGALEWLLTLARLARERTEMGAPVARMVVILAIVAAVTGLSALVFRHESLRARYRLRADDDSAE